MSRSEFTPGPEVGHWHVGLGTSGNAVLQLFGPFHIAHDDPGIVEGIQAFALQAGSVVMVVGVLVTEAWDGPGGLSIAIGGSDWALGNFWLIASADNLDTVTNDDNAGAFAPLTVTTNFVALAGIVYTGPGAVVVHRSSADTTGEADVYVLVAEPTS